MATLHLQFAAIVAITCVAVVGVAPAASDGYGTRVRLTDKPAEWITSEGPQVVFGSDHRVFVAEGGARFTVRSEWTWTTAVSQAVLVEGRLYAVEAGRDLVAIDLASTGSTTQRIDLDPPARGNLILARMGDYLLIGEDGFGVRLLHVTSSHAPPHAMSAPHRTFPLRGPIRAIAGFVRTIWVAGDDELIEIDAREPDVFRIKRRIPLARSVRSLAGDSDRLFVLEDGGLRILDLTSERMSTLRVIPDVAGRAVRVAGRAIHVAAGEAGVHAYHDQAAGSRVFTVVVGNNFFSPRDLIVGAGDTVRWTHAALGGFHNVLSCTPAQLGCQGAGSTEAFTSGAPSGPPWVYSHTFTSSGSNPYVCVTHLPFMTGVVDVLGIGPPPVTDGITGSPVRVNKLSADGTDLSIEWETPDCPGAVDYHLVFGGGSHLPQTPGGVYGTRGGHCDLGNSPTTWADSPDPTSDPTGLLWWLVIANDGTTAEGSWGTDSTGAERSGRNPDGSSGTCGITHKDLSNPCSN